jgi:hypothetical protein
VGVGRIRDALGGAVREGGSRLAGRTPVVELGAVGAWPWVDERRERHSAASAESTIVNIHSRSVERTVAQLVVELVAAPVVEARSVAVSLYCAGGIRRVV